MTDKIQKIRKEVEKRYEYWKEKEFNSHSIESEIRMSECQHLLLMLDSLQEEPKECMYSKDNYTDKDRKVLCDGCEEECRFNKKEESINNGLDLGCGVIWKDEEPVSEDLDFIATRNALAYVNNINRGESPWLDSDMELAYEDGMKAGAQWQKQKDKSKVLTEEQCRKIRDDAFELGKDAMKQQLMAKAITAHCFGFQGAALFSFRLPSDKYLVGSEVKVIVIKED